jgi:cytochrome c-type biogenesis protein CcmH/NrfF
MAAVAALALLLAALIPAAALAACPSPRASLPDIEDEVMCTVCGTPLNLAQAPQADAERAYIQQQIDACATKGQIKDRLVTEYGAAVLATPSDSGFDLAAWIVPGLVVLGALGALALAVPRWRRRGDAVRAAAPPPAPSGDEARRLDEDLAKYDL